MSAYLVSREHIDLLADAMMKGPRGIAVSPGNAWSLKEYLDDDLKTASAIGRELWLENLKSINARYPDTIDHPGSMPGPAGITPEEIDGYTFTRQPYQLTAVEILSALACYEYQSCEDPAWEKSRAYRAVELLRDATIRRLPGYADAPWEWDESAISEHMAATR